MAGKLARDLLAEIESFLIEFDMRPSYFGQQAAGNSELVSRLRLGRTITTDVYERVRSYMSNRRLERTSNLNSPSTEPSSAEDAA